MRLAFYAPLKPADHQVPSGDRAMARALLAALDHLGAQTDQPSQLRSREGQGDSAQQAALIAQAQAEITTILAHRGAPHWQAWITYHNYYKAPDLIGPIIAQKLGIPYLLIEATRARKRLTGPWASFAAKAEAACDAADVIFYLTQRDSEALRRDAPSGQSLRHLPPFLNTKTLPPATTPGGPMLSVGMMRHRDKLPSYALITQTLAQISGPWQLQIAGDGPARKDVAALMAPFGKRVHLLGALPPEALAKAYANASLLLWPGVNEAFGLSYLEAQSYGLPVVAQMRPGVCDVLAPAEYPAPELGAAPMAAAAEKLLSNPPYWHERSDAARAFVAAHHLLPAAANALRDGLKSVGVT
ncbi:MAG: glycosyltransferase [Sulfitobacter sp.]